MHHDNKIWKSLFRVNERNGHSSVPENPFQGTEYISCRYIESGLSFTYAQIQACATRHHGRGAPFLLDMRGNNPTIDLHQLLTARNAIREANQNGGHPDCIGCPNLQSRVWQSSPYLFDWVAITNFIHCNLRCEFCWLTYAPYSPYNQPEPGPGQRYPAAELLYGLMKERLLDPASVVDWGGGGEPTLIPEFDKLFYELARYGVRQLLHTNAVKLPRSVKKGSLNATRLGVLCSIDAGNRVNYTRIKGRDRFDMVFKNLAAYRSIGANVHLKYIVQSCNCSEDEINQFLEKAREAKAHSVVSDVDHRVPMSPPVAHALRYFKRRASELGLRSRFDGCGAMGTDQTLVREINQPVSPLPRRCCLFSPIRLPVTLTLPRLAAIPRTRDVAIVSRRICWSRRPAHFRWGR